MSLSGVEAASYCVSRKEGGIANRISADHHGCAATSHSRFVNLSAPSLGNFGPQTRSAERRGAPLPFQPVRGALRLFTLPLIIRAYACDRPASFLVPEVQRGAAHSLVRRPLSSRCDSVISALTARQLARRSVLYWGKFPRVGAEAFGLALLARPAARWAWRFIHQPPPCPFPPADLHRHAPPFQRPE